MQEWLQKLSDRFRYFCFGLFTIVAVAFIAYVVSITCIRFGHCIEIQEERGITNIEALSFVGVLITVLALVAAFAIVVMAIDAFAISNTVNENSSKVRENLDNLNVMDERIRTASQSIDKLENFFEVLNLFVSEIDQMSEDEDHLYNYFEIVCDRLDMGDENKQAILNSRQRFRYRRARINAISAILARYIDPAVQINIDSAIPEMLSSIKLGDTKSEIIMEIIRRDKISE